MTTAADERRQAIAATETRCPRCFAARDPEQTYCVECGLALPPVTGRLPAARRRWIRRLGWYPGDWIWATLLALVVAAAGAAAAITVSDHRRAGHEAVITALAGVPVLEPTVIATAPATGTGTLPTPPEPTTTSGPAVAARNGRQAWPANENGWTIVLVSYPKTNGLGAARQTAAQAAKSGLSEVGVLDSGRYPSLQPGYYVVFSGIYGSQSQANAAVATAHQAGFGAAYSRQIAR